MDADIQITVGTVQTDWFNCQVCDSATQNFMTRSLCHQMPKFHRIVCSLSFHSAAFERLGAGTGADGFSLVSGTKGALSHSCFAFFARGRQ